MYQWIYYHKMFTMCYKVVFKTTTGKGYQLQLLHSIDIEKSVDNLADTCVITLPAYRFNEPLLLDKDITRGTEVSVSVGYDNNLKEEFRGYVREILTNNGSITIECEDALFLFRRDVKNEQFVNIALKDVAEKLCKQIDSSYTVDCDYGITYEKFTINDATAYDVLKKIQDDTSANVWFDTFNKVLHIHMAYTDKQGDVVYSAHHNIESSNLEYRKAQDKKVEVIIETTDSKGKTTQVKKGTTGGTRITKKIGNVQGKDVGQIADSTLRKHLFDGYKGSFTAWLVPYVSPGYTAKIIDQEYPEKTGKYYVVSVKTSFSDAGGIRTIEPGIKLG